jgi:hypothetical protein
MTTTTFTAKICIGDVCTFENAEQIGPFERCNSVYYSPDERQLHIIVEVETHLGPDLEEHVIFITGLSQIGFDYNNEFTVICHGYDVVSVHRL